MSLLSAIAAMIFVVMFPVLLASRRTGIPGIASFCAACLLGAFSSVAGLASDIAPLWLGTVSGAILAVAAGLMEMCCPHCLLQLAAVGNLCGGHAIAAGLDNDDGSLRGRRRERPDQRITVVAVRELQR